MLATKLKAKNQYRMRFNQTPPKLIPQIDWSKLPEVTNDKFYPLYGCRKRFLVLVGGAGSGKSVYASQKIVFRVVQDAIRGNGPPNHFVVFRKVKNSCRISVFPRIRAAIYAFGVSELFIENKTDMSFTCTLDGSVIRCIGMDDPEKLKSIEGMTSAWLEEATEFTIEDFNQINLRLRGGCPSYRQILISFNPINALHWLKRRFFDVPKHNIHVVKSNYLDNRFIDEEYHAILEEYKDNKYYWDVYGLGEWGAVEGLVFGGRLPQSEVWTPEERPPICYGMDFGFNNPTSLVELSFSDVNVPRKTGEAYIREIIYQKDKDTAEIAQIMDALKVDKKIPIYADSAEPDRIKTLRGHGYYVRPARKGKGSVNAGLDIMRKFKLHIHSESVNTMNEFQCYAWQYNKTKAEWMDVPEPKNDHSVDAVRYGIFTHLFKGSQKVVVHKN